MQRASRASYTPEMLPYAGSVNRLHNLGYREAPLGIN